MGRTRVERRWSETGRMLALGGGALATGAWLLTGSMAVLGIMPIAIGAVALVQAVRSSGEADCPGCGARLSDLKLSSNWAILCGACKRFVEGKGGELWLIEEDRIAAVPSFGAHMPTGDLVFPKLCPACMAPSTRTLPLQLHLPRGRYSREVFTYQVPACAEHINGVRVIGTAPFRFLFRSYAYQRAFCEANSVDPAQLV